MDSYCTYHRLALLSLGSDLENTTHTVSIKVLGEKIDKAKILASRNPGVVEKDPAKYEGLYWYPGAIFIIGELVK